MSADEATAVRDVRVTLPEQWWLVPLHDPDARSHSVSKLVDRQFAGIDNQPILKARARESLEDQAGVAADLGARLMALSVGDYAGVPVPASLLVHWIDVPPLGGPGALLVDLRDSMAPADGEIPDGESMDLAKVAAGPVLRHIHQDTTPMPPDTDSEPDAQPDPPAEPLTSLHADYWLERPDGAGLVQFVFATPVIEVREAMLSLFDAIVEAARWVPDLG